MRAGPDAQDAGGASRVEAELPLRSPGARQQAIFFVLFVDFRVFVVAFRQELEQLATMSREQFLAGRDSQDIACYRLTVTIEAAIALCYHVSTRRLRKGPEDSLYAACFTCRVNCSSAATTRAWRMFS